MLNITDRPGNMLENYLNQVCTFLNNSGFHAHKNNPLRTFDGRYIDGEPFDYEFFIKRRVYCFDAKENMSSASRWKVLLTGNRGIRTNARIRKQAVNLIHCKNNGAIAFFLVAFKPEESSIFKLRMYDAEDVLAAIDNSIHYLDIKQGRPFDINELINLD